MSVFGMSGAGKDARGAIAEQGRWDFGQYKKSLDEANNSGWNADYLTGDYIKNLQDRINRGLATPEEMRTLGERADPDTKARMQAAYDRVNALQGQRESTVREGTQRNMAREDATHSLVMDDTAKAYGGLKTANTDLTDKNLKEFEALNPASEASAARTARSFSPAITNAMDRLRHAGIDPNSPQGASILTDIEAQRAHTMDDNLASGTAAYVNARTGERTAGFGRDAGLTTDEAAINRGENVRTSDAQKASDSDYVTLIGQINQDQQALNLKRMNDENAVDDKQFQIGNGLAMADTAHRDTAQDTLGGVGQQQRNNQFQFNNQGQGWSNQSQQANNTVYGNESANANWGGKLIGGIVGSAVSAWNPLSRIAPAKKTP